jgi:hypothetical protein
LFSVLLMVAACASTAVVAPPPRAPQSNACPTPPAMRVDVSLAGSCARDADCTTGIRGRCVEVPTLVGPGKPKPGPMVRACVSDRCVTDADCAKGELCFCGLGFGGTNECGESDCRDDASCPGSTCAESEWPPAPPSSLPPPRHVPRHCRAPSRDGCANIAVCPRGSGCGWRSGRFECVAVPWAP